MITDEIRNKLSANAFEVAEMLLGEPKTRDSKYQRWGRKGSISVSREGTFADFENGVTGDMIKLWAHVQGKRIRDVIPDIVDWAGGKPVELPVQKEITERKPVWPQSVHSVWFNSIPLRMSDVERWERRDIPITINNDGRVSLEIFPDFIDWFPSTRWSPRWKSVVSIGWGYNAKHDRLYRSTLHRWDPRRNWKGFAKGARAAGAAIQLGHDRSKSGVALVAEGCENAMSAAVYLSEHLGHPFEVWAGGTAMGLQTFNHADCHTLYIAHDHGEAGVRAMKSAYQRYRKQGVQVKVMTPPQSMDWNDALQSGWVPSKGQATWKE